MESAAAEVEAERRERALTQPGKRSAPSLPRSRPRPWARPEVGLIGDARWTDEQLVDAKLTVIDVPFVSIGGGLSSFAVADFLRIAGVGTASIAVISAQGLPHEGWRHLVRVSQIPDDEPLRSDSMSRMDNIWGFPGYAIQQALRDRTPGPLWSVLTEPVVSDYYNPKANLVYSGIEREAARIGWSSMLVRGHAEVVRRREAGGYFVVVQTGDKKETVVYRCRHGHLGLGYPAVRLLQDVREYRGRYGDAVHVVNAYEPHEHVYEVLVRRPGTVVVRGAGIVASRVLERLLDDRERRGAHTRIIHILRHVPSGPSGPRRFRRPAAEGWTYQPFTFAKAAGGGQLRQRTLKLEGSERAELVKAMGGTTTAKRKPWQRKLEQARRDGTYRLIEGEIVDLAPQGPRLRVDTRGSGGTEVLEADFLIDCTGLDPDIGRHAVLADLLERGGAGRNPMGRLDVDPHFVVRGTESGPGRLYASGAMTLGGYLAPVDSFWGFSHAALEICDDLARRGFCHRIGLRRSLASWWAWTRGVAP